MLRENLVAAVKKPGRIYVTVLTGLLLALFSLHSQHMDGVAAPSVDLPWETPKRLSTNAAYGAFRPILRQAPNGTLMAAYEQKLANGVRNPYFTQSTDDGETWSTPAPIRSSGADMRQITLAFDNSSQAHAAWRTTSGLFHATESQWPSAETTVLSTSDLLFDPRLAIGGDDVLHLVWSQGAQGQPHDIYHAYSTNNGATWSAAVALVTSESRHSSVPVIVVDAENNAHVFWEESILVDPGPPTQYRYEIQYRKGTKSGNAYSWSSTSVVSGSISAARRPAATVNGNDVHLSFARQVASDEQYPYYRRFTPESGWSTPLDGSNGNPVSVNTNSPFYLISSVAACNLNVFVYYHGSEETNTNEQIFGVSNYDNWHGVDAVTTNNVRNVNPTLLCRGASLYLSMERVELATLNHQVYFSASHNINMVFLPFLARP